MLPIGLAICCLLNSDHPPPLLFPLLIFCKLILPLPLESYFCSLYSPNIYIYIYIYTSTSMGELI